MSSDTAALREQVARTLHDLNTGRITPDPADPTLYGALDVIHYYVYPTEGEA